MKIVVDMNMSTKWIAALRDAGFDAQHWSDLGDIRSPDNEIMAYAARNDAVVLTRGMDFSAILAASGFRKPSVVHLRDEDRFVPDVGIWVIEALRRFESELNTGAIVSIAGSKARVRRLPIGAVAPQDES